MHKKILLAGGLLAIFSAQAEIVYYDLPDEGAISPRAYVNKTSGLKVGLSAGLDRKTELEIKDGDTGVVLHRESSGYITVGDRISNPLGSDFYGIVFELPLLADQKTYELVQNVYDMDETLVKSESVALSIDTVGIELDGVRTLLGTSSYNPSSWVHDGQMVASQRSTSQFDSPYSASGAGVEKAVFTTYKENEDSGEWEKYTSKDALINDGLMVLRNEAITSDSYRIKNYFPSYSSKVKVELDVTDEAGNKSTSSNEYQWVTCTFDENTSFASISGDMFTAIGITDSNSPGIEGISNSAGFRAFTPGDPIPENPAQAILRIPLEYSRYKSPFRGYSPQYANYKNPSAPLSVDENYAYYATSKGSISATGSVYGRRLYTSQMCTGSLFLGQNFTDDSKPPEITAATALIDGAERYSIYDGITNEVRERQKSLPSGSYSTSSIGAWIGWKELTSINVVVSPRNYLQTIKTRYDMSKSCEVAIGETECTIDYNVPFEDIDGLIIQTEGGILSYKQSDVYGTKTLIRRIDFTPPTLEGAVLDAENKEFTGKVFHNRAGGSPHGYFYNAAVYGTAKNLQTLEETSIKADLTVSDSFAASFKGKFNDLTDGDYSVSVTGYDAAGNSVTEELGQIEVDNSGPVIDLNSENQSVNDNDVVVGLESLTISLTDAHESSITSIVMTGGPASDDVQLDWVPVSDSTFTLEYPRLFPSLEEGDSYSIIINAEDIFNNKTMKTILVKYIPANIVTLTAGRYLTSNKLLLSRGDVPLYQITTSELRGNDGQLLSGTTPVSFTLRTDSDFSVSILGKVVAPGEMYEWDYQLNDTSGRIYLPVLPAVAEQEGVANFMFEIMDVTTVE